MWKTYFHFSVTQLSGAKIAKLMRFKQQVEKGVKLPPITVVRDEEKLIVYEGHHRWFASYLAGEKQILAWLT